MEKNFHLFPNANQEDSERKWLDIIDNSPVRRRVIRSDNDLVKRWNKMAGRFSKWTDNEESENKRETILRMLEDEGALKAGARVLDIGAGPGNWAIPLARRAGHVTALEPAVEMVRILRERMEKEKVENITVDQRTWKDVNLDVENMTRGFDLVFASMSPGINNPEALRKMITASRGYCYMSGFSGRSPFQWHVDIWNRFFDDDLSENPMDIIYPFNLLYSMGYRPNLHFSSWMRREEQSVDEAIEGILDFLWRYMEITPEIKSQVEEYVNARAEKGILMEKGEICQGIMFWRVA